MKAIFKILLIFFLFFPSTTSKASDKISILVLPTVNVGQNSEFDLAGFSVANTLETMHNKIPTIKEGYLNRISGSIIANPRDLLDAYAKESHSIPIPVLEGWAEKTKSDLIVSGQHRIEQDIIHLNLSVFDANCKKIDSVSISGNFKQSLVDAKKSWLSVIDNYIEFSEDTAKRVLTLETSSMRAFRYNSEVYFHWINYKKNDESLKRAFSAAKEGLQYDQSYPLLLNNYAYLQLTIGAIDEAKTNFQLAVEKDPFLIDALDGLVWAYLEELNFEGAKKIAKKLFKLRGVSDGVLNEQVSFYVSDWAMKIAKTLTPNHPKRAKDLLNISILLRQDIGKFKSEEVAVCLHKIGDINRQLGKYQKALEGYEKSLAIRLKILGGNHPYVATCYNNIAKVHADLGEYEKALNGYEKSLAIRLRVLGINDPAVAISYNNIAALHNDLGKYDKALEGYEKALVIFLNELGDNHPYVATSYNNIAMVHYQLGVYDKALEGYEKSLAINLNVFGKNHPDVALDYNNIASVYADLGQYDKALTGYEKSLTIRLQVLGDYHPDVASSYNNIASVYRDLGEYVKTLEGYEKSLAINLNVFGENHSSVAINYNNIAMVHYQLGVYDKALKGYEKSLAINLNVFGENHSSVAINYNNIALVHTALGEYEKALAAHEKSLAIDLNIFGKNHLSIALDYNNIALVHAALGEYEKALEFCHYASDIAKSFEENITLGTILTSLGYVYEKKDDLENTIKYYREAIKLKEEIIIKLDDQENRKSYLALHENLYEAIVRVLYSLHKRYPDKGYDREALEYSDRDRITILRRQLQGFVPQDEVVRRDYDKITNAERRLAAIEQQRIEELSKPPEEQKTTKKNNLSKLIDQGRREYFAIVEELKQKYPDDPTLSATIDRADTIADFSEDLPEGQTLVMYYPTEEALYIFVATSKDLQIRTVEISREHLYDLVYKYRESINDTIKMAQESGRRRVPKVSSWQKDKLKRPVADWAEISQKLYRLLIQPVQGDIARFEQVIVMPMGLLYYLPFEALLHESENGQPQFFVQEKTVRYLVKSRDVSRLGRNRSVPNFDSIIVFANPPGNEKLSKLPAAEIEARSIKEIFPSAKIFTGPEASETSFNSYAESASIIHLATHSVMDKQIPMDSYIHLAGAANGIDDGRLTMNEIWGYRLRANNLVVLSACETSLGTEQEPGSQITTMAEAFTKAKAKTVMATLWSVDDTATADFMKKFYINLQTMNKAEAKRQAQLSLLANPKTAHPLFWAPFVMLGDG